MSKLIQSVEELDAVLHWRGKHAQAIRERDALQELLNQREEQNHDLEQRRHAEQQACQAAERRGAELEGLLRGAFETAAKWVDNRCDDYVNEHGASDPETGTVEFPGDGEEYVGELMEIAEGIRGLANQSAPAEQPAPVALTDDNWHMNPCNKGHRDVGASSGVARCNLCGEKIIASTTQEAFELWNASHSKQ